MAYLEGRLADDVQISISFVVRLSGIFIQAGMCFSGGSFKGDVGMLAG